MIFETIRAPAMPNDFHPIRVLLVDDHEHVLWGLKKLIEAQWPKMTVVGTAKTVAELFAALRAHEVDMVVLDIYLGEDNSLDYLPELRQLSEADVVVLTVARNMDLYRRAIEAGAHAVVYKYAPADTLLREIDLAQQRRLGLGVTQ